MLLDLVNGLHRAREHNLVGRVVIRDHHAAALSLEARLDAGAIGDHRGHRTGRVSELRHELTAATGDRDAIGGAEHAGGGQRGHLTDAVASHIRCGQPEPREHA